MKYKNLSSGFFFFALGLLICVGSWNLKVGSTRIPGAGFLPFLTGVLISGLSLMQICLTLLETKPETRLKTAIKIREKPGKIGLAIIGLIFPLLLINYLGFLITIFIFLFFIFKFIESQKLGISTLISLLITAGIYLLFQVLLKVPFPKGFLGI
jgi:hypothetical protein